MSLSSRRVLGMRVDATSYEDASRRVLQWAHRAQSTYVCLANVHMCMEAYDSLAFRRVVDGSDLTTPDGRPLVWALRALGVERPSQVRGADLVLYVSERAERERVPIGLYGGTSESLDMFVRVLKGRFPSLRVACQISPPFRALTPEEDEEVVDKLVASGARILLVSLGCPKQERWMAVHKGRIPAVMLGVGAAFDFHTGQARQAPRWAQRVGLEWVFRLLLEPRRLWRRYAKHNPRFVVLLALQLLGLREIEKGKSV
jgi:N-acetylglucosaminyldiphosphoundecaprenol N-acetyl-beta-D-mannosaminyltransferase